MTRTISRLSDISDGYGALFVDLWGCVHDGISAHAEAVAALRGYRSGGGVVVLVTNSPRSRAEVEIQLAGFGVPADCWDAIASSGDSARTAMFRGVVGQSVWFIGHPRELPFFEPPRILDNPLDIRRAPLEEAEGIVCTSPADPFADPAGMAVPFREAIGRGLRLLCANPDIVVDRGASREWCAGALAHLYTEMGGESLYFGKPHPPIYELARMRLAALDRELPPEAILAIGDGPQTDALGARGAGIDCLFISGGLAARETRTIGPDPDPDALAAYLADEGVAPEYAIGQLR